MQDPTNIYNWRRIDARLTTSGQPTEEQLSEIQKLGVAPVHVHCIANLRVTAFLYKYWRDVQGVSELDARKATDTVWRPGGVWAKFIGDEASARLDHRPPLDTE